jgi:hypothetical protein
MQKLLTIGLLLLGGCTTVPVGGIGLCVGVCRFEMKVPSAPQTSAQQVGGGLVGLAQEYLMKKK